MKFRRYGKTEVVNFENGRWIREDSPRIVNEDYGITFLTDWLVSLFGKLVHPTKTPQFN